MAVGHIGKFHHHLLRKTYLYVSVKQGTEFLLKSRLIGICVKRICGANQGTGVCEF